MLIHLTEKCKIESLRQFDHIALTLPVRFTLVLKRAFHKVRNKRPATCNAQARADDTWQTHAHRPTRAITFWCDCNRDWCVVVDKDIFAGVKFDSGVMNIYIILITVYFVHLLYLKHDSTKVVKLWSFLTRLLRTRLSAMSFYTE